MHSPIRIAIVDPHERVRQSFKIFFENCPDFLIVGEARAASEMLALCGQVKPHIVVFDFASEEEICLIEQLCKRDCQVKVLVLTTYMDVQNVIHAVQAGASGYLFQGLTGKELEQVLRAVNEGQRVFDEAVDPCIATHFSAEA
jgi:DNA-binding NarL/FixJ family response regulator